MSETIEVGDVFTFDEGNVEYVCDGTFNGLVHANGSWFGQDKSKLVRKAAKDPYAGLTLPTPPAGYRLAKWGEEFSPLAEGTPLRWWWGQPDQHWQYIGWILTTDYTEPEKSIYAIPLDPPASTAPKSWQFRHDPWTPRQPKTLADVPEGVSCIVIAPNGLWSIKCRIRSYSHAILENGHAHPEPGVSADTDKFVRYLDPPQPAPLRPEDVPDGRVIHGDEDGRFQFWKSSDRWWIQWPDGTIGQHSSPPVQFTVTDYIAEFREASC